MRPINNSYRAVLVYFFILLAGCIALSSCAGKNEAGNQLLEKTEVFAIVDENYPTPLGLFPEYRISPGDVLDILFQIRTWRKNEQFNLEIDHTISVKFVHMPELNETQRIRPDGNISLPYIGNVAVLGKSLTQLTQELKNRYKTILRDPDIYITVPEFRSRIKELKKDLHTSSRGLSRIVTVRPDGYATFPLAGDVFVADRSIPSVKKILDSIYDRFLPPVFMWTFFWSGTAGRLFTC